jgi:uncharacterized protein (TIGR02391 family)
MNLETSLDPKLWEAVRISYRAGNYSAAILDAIHLLSDVLREKADVEGDGVALVGSALGGTVPRLKVNSLRTESEQNIQRGVEALLRGVYQAIRNPRSHGKHSDDEKDAVEIIAFIDYLLRIIGRAKSPFSLTSFVESIIDPDFVPSERYAQILVSRIPRNKLLPTCLEVFNHRDVSDGEKLKFFYRGILNAMTDAERSEFLSAVSDVMGSTDHPSTIIFVRQILPTSMWRQLDELARIRVENKMLKCVRLGKWVDEISECVEGSFGTWLSGIHNEITIKDELWSVISWKLLGSEEHEKAYALQFFAELARDAFDRPPQHLVGAIVSGLQKGDRRFKALVESWTIGHTAWDTLPVDHPWVEPFRKALAAFKDGVATTDEEDDDIPF